MKLIEEIKKRSSKWIKTISSEYNNFYWQTGYGVFSINHTDLICRSKIYQKSKGTT